MPTLLTEPTLGAATLPSPRVPGDFSPELLALLRLLRCALGNERDAWVPGWNKEVDWSKFSVCAERHRVGAFLHWRLPAHARQAIPGGVLGELGREAERGTHRSLQRASELVRLARHFADSGIPVASVKGPLLALQLYGELGQRHAGDIDLLVAPDDVERADALLKAQGYERTEPDFELTPLQFRQFRRFKRDAEYVSRESGIRLELGWRLFHVAESCRADFEWRDFAGQKIAVLKPEDNALYLFVHGARHGWFRLFWLVDVSLLLADSRVDWPAAAATARRLGLERSVSQGAALAGELLGAPVPAAIAELTRENSALGPLVAYAHRQMARDVAPGTLQAEPVLYAMRLQPDWRSRGIIFRARFMYPENWRMLPLRDRLFPLHYAAAPFLWLCRRIAGRRRRPASQGADRPRHAP